MRIVFINRFYYPDESATSQLLTDLAVHLTASGQEVHIVTGRQRYDQPGAILPGRETIAGVVVHRVWTTRFGRANLLGRALDYATFYPSAAWKLLSIASHGDVVVAKTDPPLISVVAWLCACARGAKLVNWVQDVFPEAAAAVGLKVFGAGSLLRSLRDLSLRAADHNVVLGKRMSAHLLGRGVAADRSSIIPNWADGDAVRPLPRERNPLRGAWGLEGKFVVGYSGNMGRAHEFTTILGAAELLKDDPGVVFLFIGGGHGKAFIEKAVAERGLKNIIFKPYQDRGSLGFSLTLPDVHLISQLPESEGFVFPSKYYGVSAAGLPIAFIGASDGEIARDIARFNCGAALRPGDAAGLAAFLQRLKETPELAAEMGRRLRTGFESHYDKRRALSSWSDLLAGCSEVTVQGSVRK